jgi:hypothetical protein
MMTDHINTPDFQLCPVCKREIAFQARYPRYVCLDCARLATDFIGRKLLFYNVDASGGYRAIYADTNEIYDSHQCFISGMECRADEAKFGGIVIQIK